MNYGKINTSDVANGIGVRVSLFVSGCRNHCKGCFNKDTWNFEYGELFTEDTAKFIFESIKPDYISGLSILGGEPMEPENAEILFPFLLRFKAEFGNRKSIWLYTGYTLETLVKQNNTDINNILKYVDILVDGKFDESKKNISLAFRGSSNQRILKNNHKLFAIDYEDISDQF